jgi:hypothetical protein
MEYPQLLDSASRQMMMDCKDHLTKLVHKIIYSQLLLVNLTIFKINLLLHQLLQIILNSKITTKIEVGHFNQIT